MATYDELKRVYERRLAAGYSGEEFLESHPRFARRYLQEQAGGWTEGVDRGLEPDSGPLPVGTIPEPSTEFELDDEEKARRTNLLDDIRTLLSQFFSPEAVDDLVESVIKPAISAGQSEFEVMRALRASSTYNQFFPEYEERIKNGFAAWNERQILEYRDQAKNVAKQIWGVDIKGQDLSKLISNNVSLQEFEHRLLVFKQANTMGGAVKSQLEKELGRNLSDEDLYEFFDPELDTPELDEAWENAVFKQYVNNLTGGDYEVTDEMVRNLRKIGVTTNQAIQNYQKMAQALPTLDRLAAIDTAVGGDRENPFDSFTTAFGAYQQLDANSQAEIGRMFARETARFSQGGSLKPGALLTREERGTFSG